MIEVEVSDEDKIDFSRIHHVEEWQGPNTLAAWVNATVQHHAAPLELKQQTTPTHLVSRTQRLDHHIAERIFQACCIDRRFAFNSSSWAPYRTTHDDDEMMR